MYAKKKKTDGDQQCSMPEFIRPESTWRSVSNVYYYWIFLSTQHHITTKVIYGFKFSHRDYPLAMVNVISLY